MTAAVVRHLLDAVEASHPKGRARPAAARERSPSRPAGRGDWPAAGREGSGVVMVGTFAAIIGAHDTTSPRDAHMRWFRTHESVSPEYTIEHLQAAKEAMKLIKNIVADAA